MLVDIYESESYEIKSLMDSSTENFGKSDYISWKLFDDINPDLHKIFWQLNST